MNHVTTGQIAQQLKVDRDQVVYAIRKLGIEPEGRAGIVRLFDEQSAERIRTYLTLKNNLGSTPRIV